MRNERRNFTIVVTQEAKDALNTLPSYIFKARFLKKYGFVPDGYQKYSLKVKPLMHMRHETRVRCIQIQVLCASFVAHLEGFAGEPYRAET